MNIDQETYKRVHDICCELPEAEELETWGHPTFRIRNKIFATLGVDEDGLATSAMKCDDQEALLGEGYPFYYPKYVGAKGWIGITLDDETDWDRFADLVTQSYRLTAPKKLVKLLDE